MGTCLIFVTLLGSIRQGQLVAADTGSSVAHSVAQAAEVDMAAQAAVAWVGYTHTAVAAAP